MCVCVWRREAWPIVLDNTCICTVGEGVLCVHLLSGRAAVLMSVDITKQHVSINSLITMLNAPINTFMTCHKSATYGGRSPNFLLPFPSKGINHPPLDGR